MYTSRIYLHVTCAININMNVFIKELKSKDKNTNNYSIATLKLLHNVLPLQTIF